MSWIRKHRFEVYLAAFLLMTLPAIPLYAAAGRGATAEIVFWIGAIAFGNLLVIFVR